MRRFRCSECGYESGAEAALWRCRLCGGALRATSASELSPESIVREERSLWRYLPWLAFSAPPLISLGEGWTPLIHRAFDGVDVFWKCDFINPSGSFKDRGTAVMVNYLARAGIKRVAEDSSGNGGASLATYAAAAGMTCRIYVPETASEGKIAQIVATGSEVVRITGDRQAVTEAAMADANGAYYASHNWHPLFAEGSKTVAYEVWEQLAFAAPDVIVVPAGGGSNLVGCHRAFSELHASGMVDKMPRLFGVQASACEPLAQAMRLGLDHSAEIVPRRTIAEGIALIRPVRSKDAIAAARETHGGIISVEEEPIRRAYHRLASMGFYVEPTSATAAAGLSALLQAGTIGQDDSVVVILTGTGLKSGALPSA